MLANCAAVDQKLIQLRHRGKINRIEKDIDIDVVNELSLRLSLNREFILGRQITIKIKLL